MNFYIKFEILENYMADQYKYISPVRDNTPAKGLGLGNCRNG